MLSKLCVSGRESKRIYTQGDPLFPPFILVSSNVRGLDEQDQFRMRMMKINYQANCTTIMTMVGKKYKKEEGGRGRHSQKPPSFPQENRPMRDDLELSRHPFSLVSSMYMR